MTSQNLALEPPRRGAIASSRHRWRCFPHFVLRRPGFAFDVMDGLAVTSCETALTAALAADRALHDSIAEWNRAVFPALLAAFRRAPERGLKRALDRTAQAARRGTLPRAEDWAATLLLAPTPAVRAALDGFAATVAAATEADAAFRANFATAIDGSRSALHAAAADPRFRQALFLLNADIPFDRAAFDPAQPRSGRTRQREQMIYKYLQRLCTKNETNSFFGPVQDGRIGGEAPLAIEAGWDERPVVCSAFFSHWLVADVAARIAGDPRLRDILPVVAVPSRRQRGAPDWLTDGLSTRGIAARLGVCVEDARERVAAAIGTGTWQRALPIPPAEVHQLSALLARVRALAAETEEERGARDDMTAQLEGFLQDGQDFVAARDLDRKRALRSAIEQRYQGLTGGEVRRHAGVMFRTRTVIYEDGWVPASANLAPAAAAALLAALESVLETGLLYARLRRERQRAEAAGLIQAWFGAEARLIAYDRFIAAWHQQSLRPRPLPPDALARMAVLDQDIAAFEALWTDVLQRGPAAEWPLAEFAAAANSVGGRSDRDFAIVSPDILPLARGGPDGDGTWVLGEVHHGATLDGWMLSFHPDHTAIAAALQRMLGAHAEPIDGGPRLANLIMARQMKTAPQEYPGLRLDWSAIGRDEGAHSAIGVRDLAIRVGRAGSGPDLIDPQSGDPVRFYPPAFGFAEAAFAPFGLYCLPIIRMPPRHGTGFLPRHTSGSLVVARAEWRLDAAALRPLATAPDVAGAMLAAHRLRTDNAMPRRTFLRCEDEPKPIYIDWLNPVAIELLQKLARKSQSFAFSEMLPDPETLWLRGTTGRYTSELRLLLTGES